MERMDVPTLFHLNISQIYSAILYKKLLNDYFEISADYVDKLVWNFTNGK